MSKIFDDSSTSVITGNSHAVPSTRDFDLGDAHALVLGGTRRGKTGLLELLCRRLLAAGTDGLSVIDPHGAVARSIIEWLAHPSSGRHARPVHIIDGSSAYCTGLNPLATYDDSWEAAHDAAITLTSVIESRFEASAEETPRLSRIVYVAGMLCARHGLTLLEMVEVLSVGGEQLRRSLLEDFDNRVVRRELEDLCLLASKSPRDFLNLVESTKNRFVKWLGDRRLARILGQKKGLDLRAVFDNREIVIADLSSLTYADAALVGCIYTSMTFAVARRRPPLRCARHRLILDEAESLITPDVARMCDQSAKWGVNIIAAIQRLGQLRARGDFVADALLVNCAVKICFGGLEAESARYVAENLYAGHVNLAEWKLGSERPTAVGQTKVILKNRTRSEQHSQTRSSSASETYSSSRTSAVTSARTLSQALTAGSADSSATVAMLPDPLLGNAPAVSKSRGHNSSMVASRAHGSASARSSARQSTHGYSRSATHGTTDGTTMAEGESEALATLYADLPTAQYNLEEQLHRLASELMTLPRREAVVRVESSAPFRARTADCLPAFRSVEFKAAYLPRYLAQVARRSAYNRLASDVDRELAGRIDDLTRTGTSPKAEDFSPEPMPASADPAARAEELRRALQGGASAPPALRVIGGGKTGDNP